jgi:hypothetical protein
MKTIQFYTLLYIDTKNQSLSINGVEGTFEAQIGTFIKCCEVLNDSLTFFAHHELTVLTNNKAYIENRSKKFTCTEIEFTLEVPRNIKFFAAHFKIDVFKYLSKSSDSDYSILIDSDILCINKMPLNLINCIRDNIPTYYDITEQLPDNIRETIIKDKNFLMSINSSIGKWAGGEFIGGDNKFYKLLYDEIIKMKDLYLDNYKQLHHQGSETLVSAAIEKIKHKKYICNVGLFGGIGRYWSVPTRHVQNPWKSFVHNFLIHIPADKGFIASIGKIDEHLVSNYENYLKEKEYLSKKKPNKVLNSIKRSIKKALNI